MVDDLEKKVSDDSWFAWSNFVLKQLEADTACMNKLKADLNKTNIEIAKLKVKAGVWGVIGGAIPVIIGLGLWLLKESK